MGLLEQPGWATHARIARRVFRPVSRMPKLEEDVTGPDQSDTAPADMREYAWDKERVARALRGDSAAFGELVERYSARIFTHLYRMLGNREDGVSVSVP